MIYDHQHASTIYQNTETSICSNFHIKKLFLFVVSLYSYIWDRQCKKETVFVELNHMSII